MAFRFIQCKGSMNHLVTEHSVPVFLSGDAIIDLDGTIFVQLGILCLLFLVLRRFVFTPLLSVLDARTVAIDGAREQAHGLEAELAQGENSYRAEVEKVKQAAALEQERLRQEGAQLERSLLDGVRHEIDENLRNAKERLAHEEKLLRIELDSQVNPLANDVINKVLGRVVKLS